MKVALLNPVFWPEVRRGSERFARELADGLVARGHHPRIVTSHRGRPRRCVEDGVEVARVRRLPGGARLNRRLYEEHLTHLPSLSRELRRGDDDVAHALYPTDALAALRWRQRTGRPVVLSYMGIAHRTSVANRRWRKEILWRTAHEADAVVALGSAAADGLRRWLGVEPRVIAPGVDVRAFTPDPACRATVPTILCAADAAQPRKRVGLLLDAFAIVRRQEPDARLILARGATVGGSAHPGVEFRDLDDRGALAAANREAWVHALPSWGEAFGLVLAEALACGTPVVAPNREVADSEATGLVFDGDDAAVLARDLIDGIAMAQDPVTAAACRSRALELSTDRCAAAYESLYEELRDARRR